MEKKEKGKKRGKSEAAHPTTKKNHSILCSLFCFPCEAGDRAKKKEKGGAIRLILTSHDRAISPHSPQLRGGKRGAVHLFGGTPPFLPSKLSTHQKEKKEGGGH